MNKYSNSMKSVVELYLNSCLTRKVLFEKYNSEKAKQEEVRHFLVSKINGKINGLKHVCIEPDEFLLFKNKFNIEHEEFELIAETFFKEYKQLRRRKIIWLVEIEITPKTADDEFINEIGCWNII